MAFLPKPQWRWLHWLWRIPLLWLALIVLFLAIFKVVPVQHSAFMLQHRWSAWAGEAENYPKQQWLDYASIPPALGLAAIASEDQRFPDHYGIDFVATRVAVKAALQGRSSGGGSTITQQVAKNLFLWEGRNYLRKVLEWGLALLIELIWDKQRILEVYLNIAQFGKQEYGVVEGAALLGKKPQKLRQADAALMIAVLPAPSRFDLQKPSRYMRKRQQQILLRMRQLGGLGFLEKIDRE